MGLSRPTLDTVAAAAGVSRMTVSNAYNRPDQLSAATRSRVLAVAAELGYPGPDAAARSLRRRRAGTVGVLITEDLPYAFTDPGMVALMRGLATELGAAGMAMLLIPSGTDDGAEVVRGAVVDGFIVCSLAERDEAVTAVLARRLPLVTVGNPRLAGVPFLGIDQARAATLLATHLLGLGHHRLGVINVPGRDPQDPQATVGPLRVGARRRVVGFTRAIRAVPGTELTPVTATDNTFQAGAQAGLSLLDRSEADRPTAVFATTDVLALGVLEAARQLGIDVPGRLSVVGFDDIEESARSIPPLTTVSQDLTGRGRMAARASLDLIAGRPVDTSATEPRLVVRGSSGPAPAP